MQDVFVVYLAGQGWDKEHWGSESDPVVTLFKDKDDYDCFSVTPDAISEDIKGVFKSTVNQKLSIAPTPYSWDRLGNKTLLKASFERENEEYKLIKELSDRNVLSKVKQLVIEFKGMQNHIEDIALLKKTHVLVHMNPSNKGYFVVLRGNLALPTTASCTYLNKNLFPAGTELQRSYAPIPDPFFDRPYIPNMANVCVSWPKNFRFMAPQSITAGSLVSRPQALLLAAKEKLAENPVNNLAALELAGFATSVFPACEEAFFITANILADMHLVEFSFIFYDTAIALSENPGYIYEIFSESCIALSKRAVMFGDKEGAVALATKALITEDDTEETWIHFIKILAACDRIYAHLPFLKAQALARSNTMKPFINVLLDTLCKNGFERDALTIYRSIQPFDLSPQICGSVALAFAGLREFALGFSILEKISSLKEAGLYRAAVLFEQGSQESVKTLVSFYLEDPIFNEKFLSILPFGTQGATEILDLHRLWYDRVTQTKKVPIRPKSSYSMIKIAVLVPFTSEHYCMPYLKLLLRYYNKDKFEIHIFSSENNIPDGTRWHNISGKKGEEIAIQIAEIECDALIDYLGHSPGGLMKVMALKPAPVNISMPTYATTTGISGKGVFKFTDAISDPPEVAGVCHTETLVTLPGSCLCTAPPEVQPIPERDEAAYSGFVFASFHRTQYISPETASIWADILAQAPLAKLLILCNSSDILKPLNLPMDRVITQPFPKHILTHYNNFNFVDCCLDTSVSYSNHIVTCNALTMGVPVITLKGRTFAQNSSASILSAAGIFEFTATSVKQYVALALKLYNQGILTTPNRQRLSRKFLTSPFCDGKAYINKIENAIEELSFSSS
jgi:hypothetical protein